MSNLRFGRLGSWIVLAAAVVYFSDPTRVAALTQTAGWFLKAARFALSGSA
jgi:hypothetical protein